MINPIQIRPSGKKGFKKHYITVNKKKDESKINGNVLSFLHCEGVEKKFLCYFPSQKSFALFEIVFKKKREKL